MNSTGEAIEAYLNRPFPITMHPDPDGGYVVECEDLPGCITQGETQEEALQMLVDAKRAWIEAALAHGKEIPNPAEQEAFNGRVLVRMPKELHRKLHRAAKASGVSLNNYINHLLSERNIVHQLEQSWKALPSTIAASSKVTHLADFKNSRFKGSDGWNAYRTGTNG